MKNLSTLSLALTVSLISTLQTAEALPRNANGTVISGAATIVDTDANTTTINQTSDIAELNWSNFDIAAGQTVQFNVPRAESLSINRVTSGVVSTIAGNLNSNGQVYLINEHGMTFSGTANIDTATFIASTIDTFNAQADAPQYAEINFNSTDDLKADNLIVIAPFVGFYASVGTDINPKIADGAVIAAANRATLTMSGANNVFTVDVPDAQPDVNVPMGKKLGIEFASNGGHFELVTDTLSLIAKSVSVAQNIDSLINLDGTTDVQALLVFGRPDIAEDPVLDGWDTDFYSSGHIQVSENSVLGMIVPEIIGSGYTANLRMRAAKNLFVDTTVLGVNELYVEAGENLIFNQYAASPLFSGLDITENGAFAGVTFKLGSGTLSVDSTSVDFSTLSGIETYAAGSFGTVGVGWVSNQHFSTPTDGAAFGGSITAENKNVAVRTTLEADDIILNADLDLTGTQTYRNLTQTFEMTIPGPTTVRYFHQDPGAAGETAPLTLNAVNSVTVNGDINTAGMGDFNVNAATYTVAAGKTVQTGSSAANIVAGGPPPPAPPVVPPVDPDPAPETVAELIENITPETVSNVKDVFFDDFANGSEEVVDQVASVDVVEEQSLNVQLEAPTIADAKDKGDVKAVAADCKDNVCVVLDEENTLLTVEATLLRNERNFFARLVDRAVNLRGMVDVVRF